MVRNLSFAVILVLVLLSIFTNFNSSYAQLIPTSSQGYTKLVDASAPMYQLYKNTQYGFSVEYPKNWNLVERLDQRYTTKTVLISPDNNFQFHLGVIKDQNPYAGLTSQEILGQITGTLRNGCSGTTFQNRGFTCTGPQFNTNVTNYRGVPLYQVGMSWTKTFSTGESIKWVSIWGFMPSGNDVWLMIIESSANEFVSNIDQSKHMFDSLDITSIPQNTPVPLQDTTKTIPSWIKNTAKWWSEGSIDDSDFIKGIQYLMQQGIVVVPVTQVNSQSSQGIPSWIKNTAKWWSEGSIDDSDFIKGVQYLVQNGIISTQTGQQQAMTGILSGATFYTITEAQQIVTYTDKDGVTLNVNAISNQVLLYVVSSTSKDDVNQAVTENGGMILSAAPSAGFYLVQVNDISNFISSVSQNSFVIDAHPNFVLSNSIAPIQIINYQNTPATNPDPKARVIIAVLDDFAGCGVLLTPTHGCSVVSEIQSKNPDIPILAIQTGNANGNTQYDLQWNILRAIATAQENNQKIVINQSSGPDMVDKNGNVIPGSMENYYNYVDSNLRFLSNLDWVQKNNALYYQSAGNNGQDVSPALEKLESTSSNSQLYKNMYNLVGQMDKDTQKPIIYGDIQKKGSNYGKGLLYDDSTSSACPLGTSCTAPNLVAGAAAIWTDNPDLSSSALHNAIQDAAVQNSKNGNPVFSPQAAYNLATKCVANCPSISYNVGPNVNSGTANTPPANNVQTPANTKKQLTTTITPARNLSGTWGGSFSMKDTTSDGCSFSGTWVATLKQSGNDLSGSFSIIGASSPDYPANDFCTLAPGTFNFAGTVSSSSFQFDSYDYGGFHAKGYFTTDLVRGTFNECYDESCASGSFTGSRR